MQKVEEMTSWTGKMCSSGWVLSTHHLCWRRELARLDLLRSSACLWWTWWYACFHGWIFVDVRESFAEFSVPFTRSYGSYCTIADCINSPCFCCDSYAVACGKQSQLGTLQLGWALYGRCDWSALQCIRWGSKNRKLLLDIVFVMKIFSDLYKVLPQFQFKDYLKQKR